MFLVFFSFANFITFDSPFICDFAEWMRPNEMSVVFNYYESSYGDKMRRYRCLTYPWNAKWPAWRRWGKMPPKIRRNTPFLYLEQCNSIKRVFCPFVSHISMFSSMDLLCRFERAPERDGVPFVRVEASCKWSGHFRTWKSQISHKYFRKAKTRIFKRGPFTLTWGKLPFLQWF